MTGYKRIFLDTAPIIYFLEKADPYYTCMQEFFKRSPTADYCSSVISRCEYLVFPYRNQDMEAVNRFEEFLSDFDISVNAIGIEIANQAARIRAQFPAFKMMDSLQLASAELAHCDLFLTNDKQLKQYHQLHILTVTDLADS